VIVMVVTKYPGRGNEAPSNRQATGVGGQGSFPFDGLFTRPGTMDGSIFKSLLMGSIVDCTCDIPPAELWQIACQGDPIANWDGKRQPSHLPLLYSLPQHTGITMASWTGQFFHDCTEVCLHASELELDSSALRLWPGIQEPSTFASCHYNRAEAKGRLDTHDTLTVEPVDWLHWRRIRNRRLFGVHSP
jgi:hypothetical protein